MISLSASDIRAEQAERAPAAAAPTRAPIDDPAVRAERVSVTYRTTIERRPTIRKALVRLGRRERSIREVHALRDVSFEVPHGSVVGVLGVNGAGKSTLMRTVAGILPPTKGRVEVNGRVSTLLALGVGFKAELTGRENVVLGGLAAGLSKSQIAEKYEAITEFAELGEFMDMPMRTYSSGMYGRLAFSVAVNMDPDILLIDEALSVGDARFKRKSARKMRELCGQARTIFIVSHALRTLRQLCTEIIWLNDGQIVLRDEPDTVIEEYKRFLAVADEDDEAEEDL